MSYARVVRVAGSRFFAASILILASCLAQAQSPPTAPQNAGSSYTVSWTAQGNAAYLQEKVGANGTWLNVNNTLYQYSGATVSMNYSGKTSGQYYYRLYVMYTSGYYGGGVYWYYSPEIMVTVNAGPVAPQDSVGNQLHYSYVARVGDFDGDALTDVFVHRTAGGQPGNGTLDNVFLRRTTSGTFTLVQPSPAQASAASAWPASGAPIQLKDVNLDGYVDIMLSSSGTTIPEGQIIFSSGSPGVQLPQGLARMNAKYNKFTTDMATWIKDPNYFVNHANIYYEPIYSYIWTCGYRWFDSYYAYDCWLDWGVVGYQAYYDFSPWDQDAVYMRYSFNEVINGILQPIIRPGTADGQRADQIFRAVFGVPLLRGLLMGNSCDYQYDPDTRSTCVDLNTLGKILLDALRTLKKPDTYRLLTGGEKVQALAEGLGIEGIDEVRVYNRAYEVFWIPQETIPMAPDGNVWIPPLSWLPYRADYALSTRHEMSIFLHELTHVFQARNRGLAGFGMYMAEVNAAITRGYVYTPLLSSFYIYNIEQQAEIIQDRYRIRPPTNLEAYRSENRNVTPRPTYTDLDALVPRPLR